MINKIKVLLIDDNPFCAAREPEDDRETDLLKHYLDIDQETLDKMIDFGFPIFNLSLSGRNEGFLDCFELKWLYSSSAVKDYFNLHNVIEDNFGSLFLGEHGYVPDIVIFDYALTGNEANQPKGYQYSFVRRKLDPCYGLRNPPSPSEHDLKIQTIGENYPWPKDKNNEDRFGLYAGGIIVERFRHDTPCFGVPCTYWQSSNLQDTEAGFFEWLLTDAFRDVFSNENIKGKTQEQKLWQTIIDASLPEYRNSIIELIRLDKIQVDLVELIRLVDGDFQVTATGRTIPAFTFYSRYGKRTLPLDGLFIDKSFEPYAGNDHDLDNLMQYLWQRLREIADEQINLQKKINKSANAGETKESDLHHSQGETEAVNDRIAIFSSLNNRDFAIWKFVKTILDVLVDQVKSGLTTSGLDQVITTTDHLFRVFDSVDFKKRILLSHYHRVVQESGMSSLTKDEQQLYQECLKLYHISGDKIIKPKEFSLSEIGSKGKGANKQFNRLIIFFSAIRLWARYSSFINTLKREVTDTYLPADYNHVAMEPPKVLDLLMVLFPIWTGDVVLFKEDGSLTKKVNDALKERLNTLALFTHGSINDVHGVDLREQMSFGEYLLTKSYATSFDVELPNWLKNHYHGI